jgi:hypothetical protein
MGTRDIADDGEADAMPVNALMRAAAANERLEQGGSLRFGDTRAVVRHGNDRMAFVSVHVDDDGPCARRVVDRVLHEIADREH